MPLTRILWHVRTKLIITFMNFKEHNLDRFSKCVVSGKHAKKGQKSFSKWLRTRNQGKRMSKRMNKTLKIRKKSRKIWFHAKILLYAHNAANITTKTILYSAINMIRMGNIGNALRAWSHRILQLKKGNCFLQTIKILVITNFAEISHRFQTMERASLWKNRLLKF